MRKAVLAGIFFVGLLGGCSSTPSALSPEEDARLNIQVIGAKADFEKSPPLQFDFQNAYAYAIFPRITSAAFVVGGANGMGKVYKKGSADPVGICEVTQANAGASLGAQRFAEVIFFQNEAAFVAFTGPSYQFDARAAAVIAAEGKATAIDYDRGVKVYTIPDGGLMVQAALGVQKFTYWSTQK